MADPYAVAKEMYPILKDYKYKIVNTPNKNSPYSLEHFPPGEKGSATMPRPKDISINEYGLQIFKDVRPEDIAGDIISHHLVNEDKYLSKEYQKFKNSVPSETMMSRYEYHKNNLGEKRNFNSWSERTGYPELFRGYVFNQFNKEEIDNIYNPKQKEILKNIKNYVTKKGMAKGGVAMNNQMEMAFMQQGGLKDDGMKQDPISGNEIPDGSMAKEVRDDIPAMLSEGEYVVPADVLRYYGVNFFENLRNQAKNNLTQMERKGRIGGEPLTPEQAQRNMQIKPIGMPKPQGVNEGGVMQGFNTGSLASPFSTMSSSYYQNLTPEQRAKELSNIPEGQLSFMRPHYNKQGEMRMVEYVGTTPENATIKSDQEELLKLYPLTEEQHKALVSASKDDDDSGSGLDPDNNPKGSDTSWADGIDWSDDAAVQRWAEKTLDVSAGEQTFSKVPIIGAGVAIGQAQDINNVRGVVQILKNQKRIGLAEKLENQIKETFKSSGSSNFVIQGLEALGLLKGNTPANSEDLISKILGSKTPVAIPTSTSTETIRPKAIPETSKDDDDRPSTFTDVTGSGRTQAEIDAGAGSGSYNTSPTGKVSTAKPTVVSDKGQSTSDDFATGDPGMGGVFSNKGGLMRKKKTKGK